MKRELHITHAVSDGITGHITAHVVVVDIDDKGREKAGVAETFGIDPHALHKRFDGDVEKWLAWVGEQAGLNHDRRVKTHREIHNLVGQRREIKLDSSSSDK